MRRGGRGVRYGVRGSTLSNPTFTGTVTLPSGQTYPSPILTGAITGAPTILQRGGLPLIRLSSGSIAANGAISAITALPRVYPAAYCYFPANALATSIAAGWHYCTFSTTTAGVAYLNTYTSGTPTIPASPTAVTDGKGAFIGVTTEISAHSVAVPALTVTSAIRVNYTTEQTNNANTKDIKIRFSGGAGTVFQVQSGASQDLMVNNVIISNIGATNQQIGYVVCATYVVPYIPVVLGTIDTSMATSVVITLTATTATDNFVLLPPMVDLLY